MSKAGVKKFCSLSNYLRKVDPNFYDLIQDLCMGRMLIPRKNTSGITLLRPDKNLLKDLQKKAYGKDPMDAVDYIKSLVLLEYLPNIRDFDKHKKDIPTYMRRKLPINKVGANEVTLNNKAKIKPDKDFEARSDRKNIAVYLLSGELVPTNGAPSSGPKKLNKRPKGKVGGYDGENITSGYFTGGGDFKTGTSRREFFSRILKEHFKFLYDEKTGRDVALEVLVTIALWYKYKNKDAEYKRIINQFSYDTISSLCTILRPYNDNCELYINDSDWEDIKNVSHNAGITLYSCDANPLGVYLQLITECVEPEYSSIGNVIKECTNGTIITDESMKCIYNNDEVKQFLESIEKSNFSNDELLKEAKTRYAIYMLIKEYRAGDSESGFPEVFHDKIQTYCNTSTEVLPGMRDLAYEHTKSMLVSNNLFLFSCKPLQHCSNESEDERDIIIKGGNVLSFEKKKNFARKRKPFYVREKEESDYIRWVSEWINKVKN